MKSRIMKDNSKISKEQHWICHHNLENYRRNSFHLGFSCRFALRFIYNEKDKREHTHTIYTLVYSIK